MRHGYWPVALSAVVAAAIALYATRLDFVPVQLMHDEVNFALQAQALAATGRDTNGRLLPLYFSEAGFEAGRDPVVIYLTAAILRLLPLSERAVRLPTAFLGVVSILLTFLVARRLFSSVSLGLLAAAMMALTPAHFINSRLILSIVYPIPFMLGWLLCLTYYDGREARKPVLIGGLVLGVGIYSYLASVIMMPVYLALTIWVLWDRRDRPSMVAALIGFAAALIPLALWQAAHPNRYADLLTAYRLYNDAQLNPVEGAASLFGADGLRHRIHVFWMFFSPDFLFLSGGARMTNSTREAGLLPLAFAALIPLGIHQIVRGSSQLGKVVLAGLITAPLATVLTGRLEINRVLFVIPFAVMTAAYGIQNLLTRRSGLAKAVAIALVLAVPLQFAFFYAGYMGSYRASSSLWFGGDMRGAIQEVLQRVEDESRPIYLNRSTPVERYWRFYSLAYGRADLVDTPVYYDPGLIEPDGLPPRSLVVCETGLRVCDLLGVAADWRRLKALVELNGAVLFEVYERR